MRDLVVARETRIHCRSALHHVAEQAVHSEVAHRHRERGTQERVLAAAMPARPDIAADAARGRGPLQADLVEERDEGARDVEAVGEEGPVARVGLLLGHHTTDGEDDVVGLTREQVAAAGTAVDEEPAAGGMPPLDLLAVGRRRAGHKLPRLLLDPAEGGDIVVGAQQEARLGGSGLPREARLPLRQAMRALGQPARHLGCVAVAHGALEHRQRQAVDLQIEDAGHVGHHTVADPAGDALDHAQRVSVVVVGAEEDLEDHGHRGDDDSGQRRPERVHLERVVRDVGGQLQDPGVEKQDQQEAGDGHEGQTQRRDERRQERVEQRDEGRRDERPKRPLDVHAGHEPRSHVDSQRRRYPRHEQTPKPQTRARGLPRRRLPLPVSQPCGHPGPPSPLARGCDATTGRDSNRATGDDAAHRAGRRAPEAAESRGGCQR